MRLSNGLAAGCGPRPAGIDSASTIAYDTRRTPRQPPIQRRLEGLIESKDPDRLLAGLRNQIELLSDLLAEHGTGVLITLDEIHTTQTGELRELAATAARNVCRTDLIYSTRRGYADFALAYLREQATADG